MKNCNCELLPRMRVPMGNNKLQLKSDYTGRVTTTQSTDLFKLVITVVLCGEKVK